MERNYYGSPPFTILSQYVDKQYSQASSPSSHNSIGFLRIPVGEMGLREGNVNLIRNLAADAESRLPELLERLVEVGIDLDDSGSTKSFRKSMASFPSDLALQAILTRSYLISSHYLTGRERFYILKPVIVNAGLPSLGNRK